MPCPECLGDTIADAYQLPGYPYRIEDDPTHPSFRMAMWDRRFMEEAGWNWTTFYGALVEIQTGHNPNHGHKSM